MDRRQLFAIRKFLFSLLGLVCFFLLFLFPWHGTKFCSEDAMLQGKVVPEFTLVGDARQNTASVCNLESTVNTHTTDARTVYALKNVPALSFRYADIYTHFPTFYKRISKFIKGVLSESPYV